MTFPVLSDQGNAAARQYHIVYKIPDATAELMKSHKLDLAERNGDSSGELPLAVTFVIDKDAVIRWEFVSPDFRKRAEPADVVRALRKLRPN